MGSLRRVLLSTIVVLVTALVSVAGSSISSASTKTGIPAGPIKLGALETLSGPEAAIGLEGKGVLVPLVAHLNATGGIDGHKVDLIILNDQGDPAVAVSQAQALVQDHVAGVVNAGLPGTIGVTVPVFTKAKVPIVMLNEGDEFANGAKFPYFFTNHPSNKQAMKYLVTFAQGKGITKLGILGDGSPFAQGQDADLVPDAKAQHLTIASSVNYSPAAVSVTTQIQQLRASGANGIALLSEAGLGEVYTALQQIGWSPIILTSQLGLIEGFSSLGSLAPTSYASCTVGIKAGQTPPASVVNIINIVNTSVNSLSASVGSPIENDTLLIFKKAITAAHSLNGTAVRNAIEHIKNESFTDPQIKYTFTAADHNGWPNSGIYMCKMTGFGPEGVGLIVNPG